MLRMLALFVSIGGLAACVLAASAHAERFTAAQGKQRPSYGDIVTFEHGVRVFRPLPPDAGYDDGYGAVLFTSNGHYSRPAAAGLTSGGRASIASWHAAKRCIRRTTSGCGITGGTQFSRRLSSGPLRRSPATARDGRTRFSI